MVAMWVLLASLSATTADEPDAAALVRNLGAVRYADRQRAARDLSGLGRPALPALRAARQSRDPEIRSQAAALIEIIESRLIVEPTLVEFAPHDQTLAEILRDLHERSGLTVEVSPLESTVGLDRRISVESTGAIPFWAAVDRLGLEFGLQPTIPPENGLGPRTGESKVILTRATIHTPAAVRGPFRVVPLSIQHQRDRTLGPRFGGPFLNRAQVPATGDSGVQEKFVLTLQILAEPRLTLAVEGPAKLDEATDDLGQSLLIDRGPANPAGMVTNFQGGGAAQQSGTTLFVPLKFPAKPGRTIKRLRGVLPIAVTTRRAEPIVLDLAETSGKVVRHGDLAIAIHDVRPDPGGAPILDLTVRPAESADPADPSRPAGFVAFRTPDLFRNQLELLNADGQPIPWFATSSSMTPEGTRMSLRALPGGGSGPPAKLRVYELTRSRTTVPFEFEDVPMPLP